MSNGSGTTFGYYVEARNIAVSKGCKLPVIGRTSIGAEWTRLSLGRDPNGVPSGMWCPIAETVTELQSYAAACALMAWAAVTQQLGGIGLEFRLVRAKFTYSWAVEDVATGKPVSYRTRESDEFLRSPPDRETQP